MQTLHPALISISRQRNHATPQLESKRKMQNLKTATNVSPSTQAIIDAAPSKKAAKLKTAADNKAATAKRKAAPKPAPAAATPKRVAAKPAATPKPAPTPSATKPATDKAAERAALTTRIASERVTATTLFNALSAATVSIPVKSVSAYKRSYKRAVTAHPIGRKPSMRQASALTIAALASKKAVTNGTTFSRNFSRANAAYTIENGALSDALAAGLCTYDSDAETITITNAAAIKSLIGTITKLAV